MKHPILTFLAIGAACALFLHQDWGKLDWDLIICALVAMVFVVRLQRRLEHVEYRLAMLHRDIAQLYKDLPPQP